MRRVRRVLFRFSLNSTEFFFKKCPKYVTHRTCIELDVDIIYMYLLNTGHRALITRHAIQHSRPSYALRAFKIFRGLGKIFSVTQRFC